MNSIKRRMKHAAYAVVRFVCVFALVFSGCVGLPDAFAAAASSSSDLVVQTMPTDTTAPTDPSTPTAPGDTTNPPAPAAPTIDIIEVYHTESTGNRIFLGDNTEGSALYDAIQEKGGSLQLSSTIIWSDYSQNDDDYRVEWTLVSGDPSVAKVFPGGMVQAQGIADGQVIAQATVPAQYTSTGAPLIVQVAIDVTRQSDSRYIQAITLCDENDTPLEGAFVIPNQDLSTAMATFHALVTVVDPATGIESQYIVGPGRNLHSQADDMADVVWGVGDEALGTISEGMYRPLSNATNEVFCSSTAGLDGHLVTGFVNVQMEGEGIDEYNPQGGLRVYVTYESEPDTIVADKNYTVDEVSALGESVVTYTCVTSAGFYGFFTRTGSGPYLSSIMTDVGVTELDSILTIDTISSDGPDSISAAALFSKERYYFPNYSIGKSQAGAVQVPAILALTTSKSDPGEDAPNYDNWTDGLRFCLLYGATTAGDGNATHQRKWVNTIHVVLAGGPPVSPDKPNPGSGDGDGSGKGDGSGSGGGDNGGGTGENSGGNDGSSNGGGNSSSGVVAAESSDGGSDSSSINPTSGDSGQADESDSTSGGGKSGWSIYQIMNPYPNDVATVLKENPLAPFVGPGAAGLIVAGFVEYSLWYRSQRRRPGGRIGLQAGPTSTSISAA